MATALRPIRGTLPSRFTWDDRVGRYRGPSGRLVPASQVRDALDRVLATADNRVRALAEQLRSRQVSARDWEMLMRREVKRAQIQGWTLAKGGREQLTAADYGRMGAESRKQYAYLRRFRLEIDSGTYPLDGRFIRRAELYTEAGRGTYHEAERETRRGAGFTEERNVQHAADSCAGDQGCVGQSALGWVPIGSLIPVGRRKCGPRCKCTLGYR